MAEVFQFIGEQWLLVTGLLVTITLLVLHESQKGAKTLTPQQLIHQVNQQGAVVVDVRDADDYKRGHITDAINIPHASLGDRLNELEKYKDKSIIIACKHGQHSGAASKTLQDNGFSEVARLAGGMLEWQNAQLPVVKGKK